MSADHLCWPQWFCLGWNTDLGQPPPALTHNPPACPPRASLLPLQTDTYPSAPATPDHIIPVTFTNVQSSVCARPGGQRVADIHSTRVYRQIRRFDNSMDPSRKWENSVLNASICFTIIQATCLLERLIWPTTRRCTDSAFYVPISDSSNIDSCH